jgi:hypothetical protein
MAEKRAKDRVILKLVGLHGDVYSEEEADDFKEAKPQNTGNPQMGLDIEARVDAMLEFYENCGAEKFVQAEAKYKKVLNMPELNEEQFNMIVEAHDKRKVELMI